MTIILKDSMKKAEAAANESGVSYTLLMQNAGNAAAEYIALTVSPVGKTAVILCGSGNNGGDGFVIAKNLSEKGAKVTVALTDNPKTEDSALMFSKLPENVSVLSAEESFQRIYEADIIVDALFGTGLSRAVEGIAAKLIEIANESDAVRFAVDIPSGAECDTGRLLGICFRADYTITFEAMKPCHILPPANAYCGKVETVSIGINSDIMSTVPSLAETIPEPIFEKRDKNAHKGTYGTALSLTGSYGMSGATVMSSLAALRSGVGIMKTACVEENYPVVASALPESVLIPCESEYGRYTLSALDKIKTELNTSNAYLVGCGLGVSPDIASLVRETALFSSVPVIIDADGINSVSKDIEFIKQMKAPLVLTPHPKEFSRLSGWSVAEIESDRIEKAKSFATEYGVWLVLKGANTVVATPDGKVFVNVSGNPGMATGGSGDVLSGIMLALLAREASVTDAVLKAVRLHGDAADKAAQKLGEIPLLPRDIIAELPSLFKIK